MRTLDNLEEYLSEWIDKIDIKIDKPFINGRSIQYCPYAKAAWINNKAKIVKIKKLAKRYKKNNYLKLIPYTWKLIKLRTSGNNIFDELVSCLNKEK